MTQHEIYAALDEIFRDVFARDDLQLTAQTSAKDVEGWDSFRMIEIVMAVQERFGVKVSTRDLDALKSVGDLVDVIARKTA